MTYREKRFRRISPEGGIGGVPQIIFKSHILWETHRRFG
jgi:hypothetical protein